MAPMPAGNVADQLMRFLTGARWFAGKGRQAELHSLTPLPWLTPPGAWPAVRFEIVEVGYSGDSGSGNPTELYSLPVAYRQAAVGLLNHAEITRLRDPDLGDVVGYDATQDAEACRVLLSELRDRAWHREPETQVRFHLSAAEGLRGDLEPQLYTGEQSNTSVMFGDVAMLKVFRRLELGRNLDIEVHDALSRSHSADVARLYGWVEGSWSQDGGETQHADLAMAVERLTDAHDGWGLALHTLRQGQSFAAEAAALGKALAETHQALRSAFPTAHLSGAAVADVMRERLRRATDDAPALLPYAAGLNEAFRRAQRDVVAGAAGARRLSPGADPAHAQRVEDHRLRGRTGQVARRADGAGQRLARPCRDAALAGLRGGQRARTGQRPLGRGVPICVPGELRRRTPPTRGRRNTAGLRG